MPPDDIEIRALLRAGVTRSAKHAELIVTNLIPESTFAFGPISRKI